MALYIVFDDGKETTWHIGQAGFNAKTICGVEYIQADGHELQHITDMFCIGGNYSIPMPKKGRVIQWFGDIAKTILANIA